MKPIHDLICQLQKIKWELMHIDSEEKMRREAPPPKPKDPMLDLTWFDLSHPETRSQLMHMPCVPTPIPNDERFHFLVKDLLPLIRGTRVYLQHDAYPQAKVHQERVTRFEVVMKRLEELATGAKVEQGYYFDVLFLRDEGEEFCWDCANGIIHQTRLGLMATCMILSRNYFRLAYALWTRCDSTDWWDLSYSSYIRPYQCSDLTDLSTCDRCYSLLFHSLGQGETDEELDNFLNYDGEMTSEGWWELHTAFEGVREHDWPKYLADKLDLIIDKYQLDSPRSSVVEETCS